MPTRRDLLALLAAAPCAALGGGNALGDTLTAIRWAITDDDRLRIWYTLTGRNPYTVSATVSLDGGDVVFTAVVPVGPFNTYAIFKTVGGVEGTLVPVVDTETTVPGSAELFGPLANPVLSDGNVVFWGRTANTLRDGIYTTIGGSLRVVADHNTPVPGGTGNFVGFASNAGLSIAGNRIAFLGYGEGGSRGIYIWDAGVIQKLIDSGDSIDDRNVLLLDFNRESFSGSAIVFVANFAGDFLQGVYVAPVPEPEAIAMQIAALGGLFAAVRLRTVPEAPSDQLRGDAQSLVPCARILRRTNRSP
jgi:hypothetical protein